MVFLVRLGIVGGFPSEEILDGLYPIDRILWIVWIVSVLVLGLLGETGFYALAGLLLAGWDECTGWDVGGTGVEWRDRR